MSENENENVIRFSNRSCILFNKKEKRLNDCRKCSLFDDCNEKYKNKLHNRKEIVGFLNKNKGILLKNKQNKELSIFDFYKQFNIGVD